MERKKMQNCRDLLGLELVDLVIKKDSSRLRWFGHVECKDDADWTYNDGGMMEWERMSQARRGVMMLEDMTSIN